ncbi:alpha/beta-hydrolase, partial [Thozetella sp. PMI_491]
LLFHGGGFVVGTRFMVPAQHIKELEDLGFIVISADYCLCPQVSLFDGPQRDARDVYQWSREDLPGLLAEHHIAVDPNKIVAVGYSAGATLALCLGAEPKPPVAILDFYGAKCFRDSFWFSPLAAMSKVPDFDKEFLDKIFDEPLRTSTATSIENNAVETGQPRVAERPKPDLSIPRNAWLFYSLKHGEHLKSIVKDGDFDRVDPTTMFTGAFPPTFFLHGDSDDWVPPKFSERAWEKLKELGVETRLALLPGLAHGFDSSLAVDDPRYAKIKEGFKFLASHAGLST